jgi:hypothetical protein
MINKKLGYYKCNGQEFQSKIQCSLYATQVKQPVTWSFNEDVFSKYNWAQEPSESLDQLYDRRARELREQYDYLVLSYSGGSDSHNILMSFYRQGLHIDEIVTNWIFEASKKFTILDSNITDAWNQNAEYELNAREYLQWISVHMPKTKISLYDCSRQVYESFSKAKDESWVTGAIDAVNPAATQRYNIVSVAEIRKKLDAQHTIGIVVGIDKPRCILVEDHLYLVFYDKIANIVPMSPHLSEYTNSNVEYFYWSPEGCDIIAKQSHTLLNFLKANASYKSLWTEGAWNNRSTREKILKDIIYSTTWDNTRFQVSKPIQDWYSEYDYWFTDQFKTMPAGTNWKNGIDFIEKNIDPSLLSFKKNHENDLIKLNQIPGLESYASPLYHIGSV